jgi:putative flippase GtrA
MEGKADVVYGSRYRKDEPRRVLYYWHSCMNRLLTHFSNMFTDLDLTDMETCYKLFRRDVIQSLDLKENRFGFEPEVTVKIAQARLRVYEMGVSYNPRTYEQGKKIGWKDGVRAIYCIMHYGGPKAPLPLQALIYLLIGAAAAVFNVITFMLFLNMGIPIPKSAALAYVLAAGVNYLLCISILFRHKARFSLPGELSAYLLIILLSGITDIALTSLLAIQAGMTPLWAKIIATTSVFIINFLGRKYYVFKEPPAGPWKL